mgnify:FL=1|nr:Cas9 inhibitor AcrIIA9 family protein [uncultured Blautia sp.]
MSEQLKQELEADISRLETETVADSETIGKQEKEAVEGKLEDQGGNETKGEKIIPMETNLVKQKAKEKLEEEKKKATQKNFADPVITYLLKRCEEDQGLAEDVMQEEKTWKKCFDYIVEQARKQSNGRSTAVEDRVVYEWAEDYYHKEEKQEPVKKDKIKNPVTTKKSIEKVNPPTEKSTEKRLENETKAQGTKGNGQVSEKPVKKDAASKQRKTEKTSTKSSELSGQMSLFDLL